MTLRFKVDEDLPHEIADRLLAAGYDAQTVYQEKLCGSPDTLIWEAACTEQRCLLTADKGFADARRTHAGVHYGVVLFRLPQESRAGYIRLLEHLLASGIDSVAGTLTIVAPDAIRVRRSDEGHS